MAKKILIMEDEKILQDLLKKKLEKEGHDVLAVDDGEEGLKVIGDYMPDLLLLDIMMPKVDGFEVLEKIKKDEILSSIPVIIISNSGQPVEIKRAISLGIADYIVKVDFDPDEVIGKVKKFFADPNYAQTKKNSDVADVNKKEEEEEVIGEEVIEKEENKTGARVLLVEDDDFLRKICKTKMEREGFNVSVAINGKEALKKIIEGDPQIVLLDIILPIMDGFEVLKRVKEDSSKSSIPIIMLTNLGQESEIEKGFKLGAEDYIVKAHLTVGEIIEKVKEILKKKNIK
ncbi:MAG: response regulator [Candidatus Andersenbacteria bacterium]|nr:response regulator [Candidatus Andersenbacteria bacterium]